MSDVKARAARWRGVVAVLGLGALVVGLGGGAWPEAPQAHVAHGATAPRTVSSVTGGPAGEEARPSSALRGWVVDAQGPVAGATVRALPLVGMPYGARTCPCEGARDCTARLLEHRCGEAATELERRGRRGAPPRA